MNKIKLKIYFENSQNTFRITYKLKMLIRRAILEALKYEKKSGEFEVSVTFTDNAQGAEISVNIGKADSHKLGKSHSAIEKQGKDAIIPFSVSGFLIVQNGG